MLAEAWAIGARFAGIVPQCQVCDYARLQLYAAAKSPPVAAAGTIPTSSSSLSDAAEACRISRGTCRLNGGVEFRGVTNLRAESEKVPGRTEKIPPESGSAISPSIQTG